MLDENTTIYVGQDNSENIYITAENFSTFATFQCLNAEMFINRAILLANLKEKFNRNCQTICIGVEAALCSKGALVKYKDVDIAVESFNFLVQAEELRGTPGLFTNCVNKGIFRPGKLFGGKELFVDFQDEK